MRIKPLQKKKKDLRWFDEKPPKKVGRLSQLNKHNVNTPSEFIWMARRIENVA
jgi:hypothetical protein